MIIQFCSWLSRFSFFKKIIFSFQCTIIFLRVYLSKLNKVSRVRFFRAPRISTLLLFFLRKEVIQPQVLLRLPCYDFTLIIYPTLDGWLLKGYLTGFGCYKLSWCDGRCVQGPGTYSPWHADPRLLAIPASCRRVAAYNPNWERFLEISLPSRVRNSLYRPL